MLVACNRSWAMRSDGRFLGLLAFASWPEVVAEVTGEALGACFSASGISRRARLVPSSVVRAVGCCTRSAISERPAPLSPAKAVERASGRPRRVVVDKSGILRDAPDKSDEQAEPILVPSGHRR